MSNFKEKDYKVFEMFQKEWALVTAGNLELFNSCTVGWGDMGTLWKRSVVTVYLHPSRYTCDFFLQHDFFTVSFYPPSCKEALAYMGSYSGRDGNKAQSAGLTPVAIGDSVTYAEAKMTFLCRKLYQQQFVKEDLAADIQKYYHENPKSFPPDDAGSWQPHWIFVGEVIDVMERS
ncbi:MAG: flavin reductase [Christensenellales bacterium]|jgi:flavin reductase (DIM6/NTAB) family NADH-FMN oxidoreductase RutF